jgi:outer membrane protein OmpA-like peptidoglycan-associated protein
MRNGKTLLALLLMSAVGVTPAYANYFSNPESGTMLNIGSAPNPTPQELRALRAVAEAHRSPAPAYSQNTDREAAPLPPRTMTPPPAPPPQRQAASPQPPMRQFMVFFDFDASKLTLEARHVVDKAAQIARDKSPVEITIVGHTDTVGSRVYNQKLSERRAMAVKREMVHDGLMASDIMTRGVNFQDPLVPTGPNVREPENRRAVINLGPPPIATASPSRIGPG